MGTLFERLGLPVLAGALFITGVAPICLPNTSVASPRVAAAKNSVKKMKRAIRQRGVGALDGSIAASIVKRAKSKTQRIGSFAVSGTPPTVLSLGDAAASGELKEIFWRSVDGANVVDGINNGNPTQSQCSEFWSGVTDGASGGHGACSMASAVGRSLGTVDDGFRSLCYMSNLPTVENLEGGGIDVVGGALPEGGIAALFAPESTNKVVKVIVSGDGPQDEHINLKVYGVPANQAEGNLYRVDITFCDVDGNARGYNQIAIKNNGQLQASIAEEGTEGGKSFIDVEGFLQQVGGKVTLNPAQPRSATATFFHTEGDQTSIFKSDIEVSGTSIRARSFDTFGGQLGKSDIITKFTGSTPATIRFTEGAFKDERSFGEFTDSFESAVEFRGSYYASNPSSPLLDQISGDFDDPFYAAPSDEIDTTGFECVTNDEAATVIAMNFNSAVLRNAITECEDRPYNNMNFCHGDRTLNEAVFNFADACMGAP